MLDFWNDEPVIQSQLEAVHQTIASTADEARSFIRPILLDHVQAPGKMLRPALALITSLLAGPEATADAVEVAAVVELIHLASLVHDDIIDAAPKRRGKPTLYARVGAKQAVLAGDYLLAKALGLVSNSQTFNAQVISSAMSRLLESELDQDAGVGNFFINETTYRKRIAGKTASLFSLACYAGVASTKTDPILEMICHRIGYALGMAFQIQDDILDYDGNSSNLGKHTGNDLRCGIPTLPLIYALEVEKKAGVKELASLLTKRRLGERAIIKAIGLVASLGGIEYARSVEDRYRKRAQRDIDRLPNAEVRRLLSNLLATLSTRSV